MRDPDLVGRARRAAAELEQAWNRWRNAYGACAEPLAPVSSYVGYSLEEPWGEPRVVFGVAAEEAEQLAALLDGLDRGGRAAPGLPAPGRPAIELPMPGRPAGELPVPGRPAAGQPGSSHQAPGSGRLSGLSAAAEVARAVAGARLRVPPPALAASPERRRAAAPLSAMPLNPPAQAGLPVAPPPAVPLDPPTHAPLTAAESAHAD